DRREGGRGQGKHPDRPGRDDVGRRYADGDLLLRQTGQRLADRQVPRGSLCRGESRKAGHLHGRQAVGPRSRGGEARRSEQQSFGSVLIPSPRTSVVWTWTTTCPSGRSCSMPLRPQTGQHSTSPSRGTFRPGWSSTKLSSVSMVPISFPLVLASPLPGRPR